MDLYYFCKRRASVTRKHFGAQSPGGFEGHSTTRDMTRRLLSALFVFIALAAGAAARPTADTGDADSQLIDAVALFNRGDYSGAKKLLAAIISGYPQYDAAYYYMGICCCLTGDVETGEENLREACALDPGNFWYKDYLARVCASSGHPEVSIGIYEQLIRDWPKKSELHYTLANLYARQKQYDKVLETFDEIEQESGDSEMLAMSRFQILMLEQKPEEAYAVLERYNEKYSSPEVLSAMGDFKLSQYEDSLALAFYNEALSYDSSFEPAMTGRVEAFRVSRRYPEFFEALDSYVEEPDADQHNKAMYVSRLLQSSDQRFLHNFRNELDTVVTRMCRCAPEDSNTVSAAAIYYFNTERRPLAVEMFKSNVSRYPGSLSARAELVHALAMTEDWNALTVASEDAYSRFLEVREFLRYKSIALYNLGEYPSYIKESERLIAADPADTATVLSTYSGIGDVYQMTGESAKAYKAYEKALKINPRYAPVLNNYAYFLSMEGKKLRKAYEMSKITVEDEPDNATYLDTFAWILHLQGKDVEAKPFFKHAMLYGGKDSAVMLDHYAEVLYRLQEYDLAKVYWNLAKTKNTDGEIPDLDERVKSRLDAIGK